MEGEKNRLKHIIFEIVNKGMSRELVTAGIKVSVITGDPEAHYVNQDEPAFLFPYTITIENLSDRQVQLLSRKWIVTDYLAFERMVEGEGVIGEQPIIKPGKQHTYTSFSLLHSGVGNMKGHYIFYDYAMGQTFKVYIPEFELITHWLLN